MNEPGEHAAMEMKPISLIPIVSATGGRLSFHLSTLRRRGRLWGTDELEHNGSFVRTFFVQT